MLGGGALASELALHHPVVLEAVADEEALRTDPLEPLGAKALKTCTADPMGLLVPDR